MRSYGHGEQRSIRGMSFLARYTGKIKKAGCLLHRPAWGSGPGDL
jgi:hypothetical protein